MTESIEWYTLRQLADRFEVSTRTVERWVGEGLPYVERARKYFFSSRDVNEFLGAVGRQTRSRK